MSFLIVIEGADCAGKDTIADHVHTLIGGARINFPDETVESGRIARQYLQGRWRAADIRRTVGGGEYEERNDHLSAFALQAVMLYNRAEMLGAINRWRNGNRDPVTVVRWWQSGVVYGGMDGLDVESLKRAQSFLPTADLNIYLDVSPEISMQRRALRDGTKPPELYEVPEKLVYARRRYLDLWRGNMAAYGPIVWPIIDADQPIEAVKTAVTNAILNAAITIRRTVEK